MLFKWFAVASAGWLLMACHFVFAYLNGMATTAQMRKELGIREGINFSNHGSTWWVIFVLIPLMALPFALYDDQWHWSVVKWAFLVAFVISVGMHLSYTFAPYPDFMVERRWVPSLAAVPHFVLFTGVITILILMYTSTRGLNPDLARLVAGYITWHVFVGNHMLRKLKRPDGFPPYPLLDPGPIAVVCLVAVIMTGATIYALH